MNPFIIILAAVSIVAVCMGLPALVFWLACQGLNTWRDNIRGARRTGQPLTTSTFITPVKPWR
jgi:hypothetical protein